MAVGILGLRGTGSFTADERPQNWRQGILLMFPNGDAPLTAILSVLGSEMTDDPQINWFEKGMPLERGRIIGASTTVTGRPADGADIAGASSVLEVALSIVPDGGSSYDVSWLQPNYLLMNENTEENYLVIRVDATAGFIVVRRNIGPKFAAGLQPAVTGDLTGAAQSDPIVVVGTGNQEGAPVGQAIAHAPIRHFNFTEIFRTPVSYTRTSRRTKLRYDRRGPYMEGKREGLQKHSIQLEKALMFGEREEIISFTNAALPLSGGSNPTSGNNPLRTLRGMLNWMPAASVDVNTPSIHWNLATANAGGVSEILFDQWCEELFRFGSDEKVCFAGSTALNVLNQLAKNKMTIQAVPTDRTYGMAFNRYITPFGTLMVKQHPLMSHNPTWRKDLLVVDTAHIRLRIMDDTTFLRNRQNPGDDASVDEWLTELSLETRFSGATPTNAGGLSLTPGPAVHGRLKGLDHLI